MITVWWERKFGGWRGATSARQKRDIQGEGEIKECQNRLKRLNRDQDGPAKNAQIDENDGGKKEKMKKKKPDPGLPPPRPVYFWGLSFGGPEIRGDDQVYSSHRNFKSKSQVRVYKVDREIRRGMYR